MTDSRDIGPAQAAQITKRIGQTFDFVRDAIDDPRILEHVPSGSTLMFRGRMHQGRQIRLVAYRPQRSTARWGAHVSGATSTDAPGPPPCIETRSSGRRGERWPSVEDYETAAAALDALEARLRDAELSDWVSQRAVGE